MSALSEAEEAFGAKVIETLKREGLSADPASVAGLLDELERLDPAHCSKTLEIEDEKRAFLQASQLYIVRFFQADAAKPNHGISEADLIALSLLAMKVKEEI